MAVTTQEAFAIIEVSGPMSEQALIDRVADLGVDAAEAAAIVDEMMDEYGVWYLGPQLLATKPQITEGRTFTHRVEPDERAGGFVRVDPDLAGLTMGFDFDIPLDAEGRLELKCGSDGYPVDHHVEVLAAPPAVLDVPDQTLLGFTINGGSVVIAPAEAAADDDVPRLLADAFADHIDRFETASLHSVVGTVAATDVASFTTPRRPMAELLAAAGLECQGDMVAVTGFDWSAMWARRREEHGADLAEHAGLDELDGKLFADLIVGRVIWRDGLDDDRWEGIAAAFASPGATGAFLSAPDGTFGFATDDDNVAEARAFASAVLERTHRPPAGALVTVGWCDEFAGETAGYEASANAALQADPTFDIALLDAAWLASVKGDAARAVKLRASAGAEHGVYDDILAHYAGHGPRVAGRNDTCPCGSGAKYKHCCDRFGGHSLADRGLWLYYKAVMFANRPRQRLVRLGLALAAAGVETIDDAIEATAAMFDEVITDLALFDEGVLAAFARELGPLLPPDEAALADSWCKVRHRLWELVSAPDDGPWVVRDVVSGEEVPVVALPGATEWEVGQRMLAVVVPRGNGEMTLMGTVRRIDSPVDAEVASAIDAGASAGEIALTAVGPTLTAHAAALEAAWSPMGDMQARCDWLFPDEDLSPSDLSDHELLTELLEDHYLYGYDDDDLHSAMLAAVSGTTEQILFGDPPEVWDTALRLEAEGYARFDVVTMLSEVLIELVINGGYDLDRHLAALARLPDE